jgi:hypothetical protein
MTGITPWTKPFESISFRRVSREGSIAKERRTLRFEPLEDRRLLTTYYVDPVGSDANSGSAPMAAWQSLAKVNATTFQPGDSILFKSGGTWTGTLQPQGSGNGTAQITLGAYGTGAKPRIDAAGGYAAINLDNQQYWTIQGFDVTNWAGDYNVRMGIRVHASGSQVTHGIHILNNEVHDIHGFESVNTNARNCGGIFVWIDEPGRADDVLIQGNTVKNVYGQGISFWGEYEAGGMNYANCSSNVVARGNTVLYTSGDGLLLLGTSNELAEYNEVGYAGVLSPSGNNIAAAWPSRHVNGVWQYNYVHDTANPGNDGTAFDNDGYVQGTTYFQYNYTYNNYGGFFMEYKWDWSGADTGNSVVRYNISVDESRIVATNRVGGAILNNVFYTPIATLGVDWTGASADLSFYNNIFWAQGWSGNNYSYQYFFNNTFYGGITVADNQSNIFNSYTRNPLFVNPNEAGNLAGFILQTSSAERASGMYRTADGSKDFWGASVPSNSSLNRGASQIASIANYTVTPSYLGVLGASTVAIPANGVSTSTFTAAVRDQNFRPIASAAPTWSISPTVSGVSIDPVSGVLTVSNSPSQESFAVVAQYGSLSTRVSVHLTGDVPPTIVAWQSAEDHGNGLGELSLAIPDDGAFSEPRLGGIHRLLMTFSKPISASSFTAGSVHLTGNGPGGVSISVSNIGIATSMRSSTLGVIEFSPALPDFARYVVRIDGLTDLLGTGLAGDRDRIVTALQGDVNGDRVVDSTDLLFIKSQFNTRRLIATSANQIRADYNMDGIVSATDAALLWCNRNHDARSISAPLASAVANLLMSGALDK